MNRSILLAALPLLAACATSAPVEYAGPIALVKPVNETAPMAGEGDRADDPALWVNAADPASSLILATNKDEGLYVYALDGGEQRSVLPQVRIAWLNALPVPTGFDALLARLTPIGAGVLACLKSGASSTALIREGHDYICDAYAVPPSDRAPIIDAYLRRFPRFADAMAAPPRRRRARVA